MDMKVNSITLHISKMSLTYPYNMLHSIKASRASRVVTRARVGFRTRVTYFELGCPETNIDPIIKRRLLIEQEW